MKKQITTLLLSTMLLSTVIPQTVIASTEYSPGVEAEANNQLDKELSEKYGVSIKNASEETRTYIEGALDKTNPNILKAFNEKGGTITFMDKVIYNGKVVGGLYSPSTQSIKISTYEEYGMRPQWWMQSDLLHEFGHFVYINGNVSQEQKSVIKDIYNRYHDSVLSFTSEDETYAQLYSYDREYQEGKYSFLNGLSQSERQVIKDIQSII